MSARRFITPEAVEAVARVILPESKWTEATNGQARAYIAAFLAHIEGERPCERCDSTGHEPDVAYGPDVSQPPCDRCHGTGRVTDDPLLRASEAKQLLDFDPLPDSYQLGWNAALLAVERMAKEGRFDG